MHHSTYNIIGETNLCSQSIALVLKYETHTTTTLLHNINKTNRM